MATIFPFGEGKTEKVVFRFLIEKQFQGYSFRNFVSVGGRDNFRSEIPKTVQIDLGAGRDEIRILTFRDLDAAEQVDDVVQSFQDIVQELLEPWRLRPSVQQIRPNTIYKWEVSIAPGRSGLRLVLHIANHADPGLPVPLLNQTTDGYILRVGLTDQVLHRFARESKVGSTSDSLRTLITADIPGAIKQRGIAFDEDKDYLAAYLAATRFWVVKRTEEQARLVKIILERAWRYNQERFKQVFASWFAAIEEVVQ